MLLFCLARPSLKPLLFQSALALAIAGVFSFQPIYAQTPVAGSLAPAADLAASPVDAPASENAPASKRFWRHSKADKVKDLSDNEKIDAKVAGGVLTVDGLVAKVELNYDIHHAKYLYFFAPGVGTAVVSRVELPGATRVKDAIHGSTIEFAIDGHSFALENDAAVASMAVIIDNPAIKVKKEKEREIHDAWVMLDENAQALYRTPQVGYGDANAAPYVFPLSDAQAKDTYAHFVQPPPMPANVLPRTKATQSGGTGGK